MSNLYGPEPKWETIEFPDGGWLAHAICTAPDHSHVPFGGQCRCGLIPTLGITRDPFWTESRNDLQFFSEAWEASDE